MTHLVPVTELGEGMRVTSKKFGWNCNWKNVIKRPGYIPYTPLPPPASTPVCSYLILNLMETHILSLDIPSIICFHMLFYILYQYWVTSVPLNLISFYQMCWSVHKNLAVLENKERLSFSQRSYCINRMYNSCMQQPQIWGTIVWDTLYGQATFQIINYLLALTIVVPNIDKKTAKNTFWMEKMRKLPSTCRWNFCVCNLCWNIGQMIMITSYKVPWNIMIFLPIDLFKCLLKSWIMNISHTTVVEIISQCNYESTVSFFHNLKIK